ncbi:unnamed protein product [Linum trigynum]|uniref:Uncharacterized protein n=1 Tax=Linum trigynum TaxID=586398 RepID=A0AAV2D4A7_9ROSI
MIHDSTSPNNSSYWDSLIAGLLHSSESARTIAPSLRGNNDGDAPSSTAPSDSSDTTDHHHRRHLRYEFRNTFILFFILFLLSGLIQGRCWNTRRNHRLQHRSSRDNGGTAAVLPLAVYGPRAASSGSNNKL